MNNPFPSIYEQVIYKTRYARWLPEEGRRENWDETVNRYVNFMGKQVNWAGTVGEWDEIRQAILNFEVMPSMRALMTAGPALDRCNVAAYNCAYTPVDSLRAFDEAMYILLCGTGVGFSVETKYVEQLPRIAEDFVESDTTVVVGDSKEGWARALREVIALLVGGQIPRWDTSRVRPAGSVLKTFGGRASGPEPLEDVFRFAVKTFRAAAGRRLSTLECHDLLCKIASAVVVGGVRRSAMISLFDCTDDRMLKAKSGEWWHSAPYRALANNSAVYNNRAPDPGFFMDRWQTLYDSKAGEPGIFSRYACQAIARRNGRRDADCEFGTNPCSEIILRPFQFCNLTEVVVRAYDTPEDLFRKARIAAVLGTIQASLTDFSYLRKRWNDTCNEERLLGVSLTGICDNPALAWDAGVLEKAKQAVVDTNVDWANRIGIASSAAVSCVKPSGTVSQLVNSSSGLHPRHSNYYLRTIRADNKDPVTAYLKDAGVYWEPAIHSEESTSVFYFPIKSPDGALTREDQTAIEALELWEHLQDHWCEHKPSATISIREEEWLDVAAWVYKHFDKLSGIAFLPYDGGSYQQAPYQEITEEEYNAWLEKHPMPDLNWDDLRFYETEDQTTGSQEYACTGGSCDVP